MKAVILWLSMNTSKVVNRSFSLLYFAAFVNYQTLISDIDAFTLVFIAWMKAVGLWLAVNTFKEVNSSFIVFFSIRYQTLISDIDTFLLALFIVSLIRLKNLKKSKCCLWKP